MILDEYKSGNAKKRVFLQTLKAALIKKKIDVGDKYTNEDGLGAIKIEYKQLKESAKEQEKAKRPDLLEETLERIKIIEQILPEKMDEQALQEKIDKIIEQSEDKSFSSVIKTAMKELRSEADGSDIARIVKERLESDGQ